MNENNQQIESLNRCENEGGEEQISPVEAEKKFRNIAILTEWDGTEYAGWQIQHNAPTLQEHLERALTKVCKEKIKITGCSRTDAGVHASGHVGNFKTSNKIAVANLPLALNSFLPSSISVRSATEVSAEFNARFDAVGKQYSYYIYNTRLRSAILDRYSYRDSGKLDFGAMEAASRLIEGKHDFACFMAAGGQVKTTVRTVFAIKLAKINDLIRIIVHGDGFLYNMVRIIAGTLLYVGLGKLTVNDVEVILRTGDRKMAGKTLPACGLFLDKVYYSPNLFDLKGDSICELIGMMPTI